MFETYTHQTQQELEVVRAAKPPLLPREVSRDEQGHQDGGWIWCNGW